MNSQELKQRLSDAKKSGFWEVRYDHKVLDHEYYFEREFKRGYELQAIDYPCGDKGQKFAFPRAKFKFNKAMEEDIKLQIEIAEENEKHSARIKAMTERFYDRKKIVEG